MLVPARQGRNKAESIRPRKPSDKVSAEALIPAELIERRLRTTPARMVDYWRMAALGGVIAWMLWQREWLLRALIFKPQA